MYRSQPTGRVRMPSDTTYELEPIPGLIYSDAELLSSLQDQTHAHEQRIVLPNHLPDTEPVQVAPPRHASTRSPTPISDRSRRNTSRARRSPTPVSGMIDPGHGLSASAVMTHRAEPRFSTTHAIDIPMPLAGSSRGRTGYQPGSGSDIYADSDWDFEQARSSLFLEIRPDMQELEKWELPSGGSVKDFLGNGWKLKLVLSYTSVDPDFEPSISVKRLEVDCTLADIPRNIPATAKRFRKSPNIFRVSHNGGTTKFDNRGNIEEMNPTRGIYKDDDWHGPTLSETFAHGAKRMEYSTNIYIPIPVWLFATSETRAFDIEVRAWVSMAHGFPVTLRTLERLNFSNFIQINGDDSKGCALLS